MGLALLENQTHDLVREAVAKLKAKHPDMKVNQNICILHAMTQWKRGGFKIE